MGSALAVLLLVLIYTYESFSDQNISAQKQVYSENREQVYTVTRVIDGDTLDVTQGDTTLRIRLIGINTPESVDPRRPRECYGKEASELMKEIAFGKDVKLVYDIHKPRKDDNGRELAYVVRNDDLDLGAYMIESGAAYEYTYKREYYENQQRYIDLETKAKEMKRGLWAENTCNGKK